MNLRPATLLGLSVIGVAAMGWATFVEVAPKIVYNGSPSLPIGFYRVTPVDCLRLNDLVVVPVPETYEKLALERRYLGPGALLIKRVAALSGDRVCVLDGRVLINGGLVARALKVDSTGRPMPVPEGCRTLREDEFFALIEEVQASFDSRYFGALTLDSIIGRTRPLWPVTGSREPTRP